MMSDLDSEEGALTSRWSALWNAGAIDVLEVWFGCEGSGRACVLVYPKGALSPLRSAATQAQWAREVESEFEDMSLKALAAPIADEEVGRRWASVAMGPVTASGEKEEEAEEALQWALDRFSYGSLGWRADEMARRLDKLDELVKEVSFRMGREEGASPLPCASVVAMMGSWSTLDEADLHRIGGAHGRSFIGAAEAFEQAMEIKKATESGALRERSRI